MTNTPINLRRGLRFAACFFSVGALTAQVSAAAVPPPNDEVVALDPFSVTTAPTKGYMASTTASGTAMNMPLKDVPMSINVITSEFLTDAGLTNSLRALDFVSSVTQTGRDEIQARGNMYSVRGFANRTFLFDGIPANNTIPSQLIDRIEVVKGPNTLYGQSDPGGLINRISKAAGATNFANIKASYGSWNTTTAEVDVNRKVTGTLNIRVLGGYTDTDGWRWVDGRTTKFSAFLADWRPLANTRLRFTYSATDIAGNPSNRAAYPRIFRARDLNGDGDTADRVNGIPENNVRLLETDLAPWDWTSQTENSFYHQKTNYFQASVQQKIGQHLNLIYLFGRSDQSQGTGFREFNTFDIAGNNPANHTFTRYNDITDVHTLNANLNFAAGPLKHTILAGVRFSEDYQRRRDIGLRANVAAENTALNQLAAATGRTIRRTLTVNDMLNRVAIWDDYTPTQSDFYQYGKAFGNSNKLYENIRTYYLSDSIALLDNRLRFLGGIRRIAIEGFQRTGTDAPVLDALGQPKRESSDTSSQFGVNYRVNDHVVPFANYATAFNPNGFDAVNGDYYDPERSKAWEVGVKFDEFLGGRISGSISYFDIRKSNVIRADFNPVTNGNTTDITDDQSTGVDLELFINPTPSWQIVLGYTHLDAVTIRSRTLAQGLPLQSAAPDKITYWMTYRFDQGPLEGLRLGGGGITAVGPIYQFSTSDNRYIFQDTYTELSAFASYGFKIKRAPLTLSLNVKNLANEFYLRSSGNTSDPRSVTLSASYKF